LTGQDFHREIRKYNKVVIWGLRTVKDTYRYIHQHFYMTLKKTGTNVVWVDDSPQNHGAVERNDLVLAVNVAGRHLPVKDGVYYCLHNFEDSFHQQFDPRKNIRLQVYTSDVELRGGKWNEVTFFDKKNRLLYQPWATDLLPGEFREPVTRTLGGYVFWIGSVWNNPLNQGNLNEINVLKQVLGRHNIKFVALRRIPNFMNVILVRMSRVAPAITGRWQAEQNYLPCRMWKNISYGQLGISNVKKFNEVFRGCTVKGDSIEELIENALSMPANEYREMILQQQEIVKNHTYIDRLACIIRAFDQIS